MLNYNITLELLMGYYSGSPLDQFGDDEDVLSILDYAMADSIPGMVFVDELFDWFALSEISNLGEWTALLLGNAGTFIFDDDDTDASECEDSDLASSSTQSSIFIANIVGMFPGVETTTSDASLTFMLSISTIISVTLLGFSLHSIRYVTILYPTGTPTIMAPFIIMIEFISYIARAVSLGMRLFANMFAGHSLVKILMSLAWLFLNSALPVLSIPVFILLAAIFFMEVGIAYLQSYVFTVLSAMYLEDALSLGH